MNSQQEKYIKVLLCQLKPVLKGRKANLERVSLSLKMYSSKDKIDIILFPEMSFTGYNFKDKEDVQPLACTYGDPKAEEFQFAIREAKRINCYVIFGYIEKQIKNEKQNLYNSAAVIDRKGNAILNYRKSHLYYNDELWSEEGDGFKSLTIQNLQGDSFKAVVGICMDINPYKFQSGQYQWADFAVKQKAQLLLFLTNWVDSEPNNNSKQSIIAMYNYWLHRLRPLITPTIYKNPALFLAADRVGAQYDYFQKKQGKFFGSSCAIHLNPLYVIKNLEKEAEGFLLIQSKLPK